MERIREQVAATRTSRFGRWTHGERDGDRAARNADRPAEAAPDPELSPADTVPDRIEPPGTP